MPKKGDLDTCKHCGRRILFGPYHTQKGAVVKQWAHSQGIRSCLSKPKGWEGEWPKAEPVSGLP